MQRYESLFSFILSSVDVFWILVCAVSSFECQFVVYGYIEILSVMVVYVVKFIKVFLPRFLVVLQVIHVSSSCHVMAPINSISLLMFVKCITYT